MLHELAIFARSEWQMSPGERAALEGFVAHAKPDLAVEIGTAEGGSLERIAAHSAEVHAVDLTDELLVECPANAEFHAGDSKQVLPRLLAGWAAERRNVDFVLVDGDHSREGVRSDLSALLESPAVGRTLILLHDSFDPDVRSGIEAARPTESPKVVGLDLDFVPGRVAKAGGLADRFLGGFALVIVDTAAEGEARHGVELGLWSLDPRPILFDDPYTTLHGRDRVRRELDAVQRSRSWRITAPLRALKAAALRTRRPPDGEE